MRRHVEIQDAAEAEGFGAFQWYLERSETAARGFRAELNRCWALLADEADRFPPFYRDARRVILVRYPYSVVFRIRGDTVVVVAIVHAKRRPGYWRRR